MKLTTHLHLMRRLRIKEPLLRLFHMPSWRAQEQSMEQTPPSIRVDYVTTIFPIFYGNRKFRRIFRRATPVILHFSTRWTYVVNFMLRPVYLRGKVPRYPLNWRNCGPQRRSGRFGEEKNILPLLAIEPRFLGCPACFLYIIATELSRLPFS